MRNAIQQRKLRPLLRTCPALQVKLNVDNTFVDIVAALHGQ
ncbi:hypothetical protein AB2N08_04450 [Massilia aurea]